MLFKISFLLFYSIFFVPILTAVLRYTNMNTYNAAHKARWKEKRMAANILRSVERLNYRNAFICEMEINVFSLL